MKVKQLSSTGYVWATSEYLYILSCSMYNRPFSINWCWPPFCCFSVRLQIMVQYLIYIILRQCTRHLVCLVSPSPVIGPCWWHSTFSQSETLFCSSRLPTLSRKPGSYATRVLDFSDETCSHLCNLEPVAPPNHFLWLASLIIDNFHHQSSVNTRILKTE